MGLINFVGKGILYLVFILVGSLLIVSGFLAFSNGGGLGWILLILGVISVLTGLYFKKEMRN